MFETRTIGNSAVPQKISKALLQLIIVAALVLTLLIPFFVAWTRFVPLHEVAIFSVIFFLLMIIGAYYTTFSMKYAQVIFPNHRQIFVGLLIIGITVRIIFFIIAPKFDFISDAFSYVRLGYELQAHGTYITISDGFELRAFRPPAYPLFLSLPIALLGKSHTSIFISNIALYIGTLFFVYRVAVYIEKPLLGITAVGLITLWPNQIFFMLMPLSEHLASFLISILLFLFCKTNNERSGILVVTSLGIVSGLLALTKPYFILIPIVIIGLWIMSGLSIKNLLRHILFFSLPMIVVVGSWTYRNYLVLDDFLLISSNGGSVLYRSNNPLATGGYTKRGVKDLDSLRENEVEWSSTGMKWGIEWIKTNPIDFLKLALLKQRLYLGRDDYGSYYAFIHYDEAQLAQINSDAKPRYHTRHQIFSIVSDIYWLYLAGLMSIALLTFISSGSALKFLSLPALLCLFVLTMHSVFESLPRHHGSLVPAIALIAATAISRPRRKIRENVHLNQF